MVRAEAGDSLEGVSDAEHPMRCVEVRGSVGFPSQNMHAFDACNCSFFKQPL